MTYHLSNGVGDVGYGGNFQGGGPVIDTREPASLRESQTINTDADYNLLRIVSGGVGSGASFLCGTVILQPTKATLYTNLGADRRLHAITGWAYHQCQGVG